MNSNNNQHAIPNSPAKLKEPPRGNIFHRSQTPTDQSLSLSSGTMSDSYTNTIDPCRKAVHSQNSANRRTVQSQRTTVSVASKTDACSPGSSASQRRREIACPRLGCGRFYSSENSLRNHLRIKHAYRGPRTRQDSLTKKDKRGARNIRDKQPYVASFNDRCLYQVTGPLGAEQKKIPNRNSWPVCQISANQNWTAEYIGSGNFDQSLGMFCKWQLQQRNSNQSFSQMAFDPNHASQMHAAEPVVWVSSEGYVNDDGMPGRVKDDQHQVSTRRGTFPYQSQSNYSDHMTSHVINESKPLDENYDSELNAALPRHARAKVCTNRPVWASESQFGLYCPEIGRNFFAPTTPAVVPRLVNMRE